MPDETREPARRPKPRPASRGLAVSVPGYRIDGELGRGGMGVVYRATQLSLGRPVALKVVLSGLHVSERERQRFDAEAKALAQLQHANIVGVIDFGEAGGLPWFALEYCPGGTLADRLHDAGPLDPAVAAALVATLARAVHAVHQQGMIHRDLKPANVLFAADGMPKVADFGLVRDSAGAGTVTGAVLGTPAYMAPEQARGEAVDCRADVYALGAILYECLTGRPPYSGPSAQVVLAHVMMGVVPVVPVRQLRPEVPAWLAAVCERAMAREVEGRYATAGELAAGLGGAVATIMVTELPVVRALPASDFAELTADAPVGASAARGTKPVWPWALSSAGAGLLAVCVLSAVGFRLLGRHEPQATQGMSTRPETPVVRKPSPMKWPCTAQEAWASQKAWAAYLNVKMERDIDLPGGEKLTVVLIPPGTFMIGSPKGESTETDEGQHEVTIPRAFWLGKTEVTQAQYKAVTNKEPSWFAATGDGKDVVKGMKTERFPVENVSWGDADAFCKKLKVNAGLPTEAQWEWACRAGTETPFHFGKELNGTQANCDGKSPFGTETKSDYLKRPQPVGSYRKYDNAFGLSDMHGNVWEWCADWYGPYPAPKGDKDGAVRSEKSENYARVLRGGSWIHDAINCRSADRNGFAPVGRYNNFGFRVCVPLD